MYLVIYIEICVKYSDYLTKNKHIQVKYRVSDEEQPQYKKAIFQLPTLRTKLSEKETQLQV